MPPLSNRRQRRRRAAVVGGAAVSASRRRDAQQQQQQQQQAPPPAQPSAPTQPVEAGGLSAEAIEKLKELSKLHEQNVLTDEEFEREKAKLLGS